MFKRANKITALLVAAASIMSVVPAMAADTQRLGNKEGTIYHAFSFEDGKYIYEGYRTDADDTGIYYNGGDKEKAVEDLEDYELRTKFGTKYAYAYDNNDQYLVDLSTGKVVSDETPEDKADAVKSKLKSTLKKTDRYANTGTWDSVDLGDSLEDEVYNDSTRILGNQFGEVWYAYSAKGDDDGSSETSGQAATKASFKISAAGKTDAQITADITAMQNDTVVTNVFTKSSIKKTVTGGDVYIVGTAIKTGETTGAAAITARDNFIADYPAAVFTEGTNEVGGEVAKPAKYYGFVSESGKYIDVSATANIYVYSEESHKTVKVSEYNKENKDYGITVALDSVHAIAQDKDNIYTINTVSITEKGSAVRKQIFLQKISKAQGDKKDGAYLPKSVASYQLDDKSIYDNDDVKDAYGALLDASFDGKSLYGVRVKDDTVYVTRYASDKVKVFKLKLKKDKLDTVDGYKKVDAYVVKKDGDSDNDIVDGAKSISIDVDGNTWALEKGKIVKFTGTDKKEKYTCDRSLDSLDVYNEGNLIAWDSDGDVYTTVQEGKKKTEEDGIDVNPDLGKTTPAKVGWDKLADGTWNFYDATGAKVVNNWANVGGVWYYLKADGVMATGWQQVGSTWYYLNASGAMATGWINDNGTWYYLQSSGAMKTGWLNDNGTWYYLNASGAMLANTTVDGYKLGSTGAWTK